MRWAVIGGGNGGQSAAGHLGVMGFEVTLYDIVPATVDAVSSRGGVEVTGVVSGFGPVRPATGKLADAIDGVDIVMIITPATAHRTLAESLAEYLTPDQTVFIHPGSTFGALEFLNILREKRPDLDIPIAESLSLLYACRATEPGKVSIKGLKKELMVSTIPATRSAEVVEKLRPAYGRIYPGTHVLETSLSNLNAVMHPSPSILNTSMIESKFEWEYYGDGITPTIGRFVEDLDRERVALGAALGLTLAPIREMYRRLYGVEGESLGEIVKQNEAYKGIPGQKRMDTRYLLEDVPMGLVPMVSLAKELGVPCERMETVCRLAGYLLETDFFATGRSVESVGLRGLTPGQMIRFVETGDNP
jgi:opine dehydrogenase